MNTTAPPADQNAAVVLEPLSYALDYECPVQWPIVEDNINSEYPFTCIGEEAPENFVIRRYLETLWLPSSIMHLHHFVKSLRRVVPLRDHTQSIYAVLKPLLLSVRGTQAKYHQELPQILRDGAGAGEIEETMMWYAWSKEKFELDKRFESDVKDGIDAEETWKKEWMEKLERRDVQIQILLYFHLLSLPPPPKSSPAALKPGKRKRKQTHGPPSPVKPFFPPPADVSGSTGEIAAKASIEDIDESLGMEDRLEFFMDRLSLWQLMASLNASNSSEPSSSQCRSKDQRDWMQIFCEDVVETLFRDRLPELCDLLRTKVFPHSPFSPESDSPSSLAPRLTSKKRKAKENRPASPLRLQELERHRNVISRTNSTHSTMGLSNSQESSAPQRHRSRSRSVSVSVEEVRARGASRGGVASSKNLFKGEVEMKRTSSRGSKLFKPTGGNDRNLGTKEITRQNSSSELVLFNTHPGTSKHRSPTCKPKTPETFVVDTPVRKVVKKEDDIPDFVMDSPDLSVWNRVDEDGDVEEASGEPTTIFAKDTPIRKRLYLR